MNTTILCPNHMLRLPNCQVTKGVCLICGTKDVQDRQGVSLIKQGFYFSIKKKAEILQIDARSTAFLLFGKISIVC